MNYVDKMFDITLFVSPGDLDNKAFNPQLFFEAINEIDTGTGTMDLITSLSKTKNQRVQKRAKTFVQWFKKFVKTNPYNHELIYQIFEDPSKMKETWKHMQEFYNWGLISKREFKKTLIECYKIHISQPC